MIVTLVGTGTLVPSARRSTPALALEGAGFQATVDGGTGTLRRQAELGIDFRRTGALLFTHIHPDHTLDLLHFLFASKYTPGFRRSLPIRVLGPPGFGRFVEDLREGMRSWTDGWPAALLVEEVEEGRPFALGPWSVAAHRLQHPAINFGYRVVSENGGILAVTYPFLKRFFSLPQAYLGAAFGWSVPMAFAAQTGAIPPVAWVLFVSVVLWTTAYDTMYAMVDREDDLVIGVRSSAILFGRADRVVIAALQLAALGGLGCVGWISGLGHWYWVGLAVAAVLAAHQQVLIRNRQPAACFRAFLNNNLLGLAVFAGLALDYLFRG